MTRTLRPHELRRLRLRSQRIHPPSSQDVTSVVQHLLAMQGQELGEARRAIASRTHCATVEDVRAAFDCGALVRSWPLRGTLHVTTPDDLSMLLHLTGRRTFQASARRRADLGIDDELLTIARRTAEHLLTTGPATRAAYTAALREALPHVQDPPTYHLLFALAVEGFVCWGPMEGNQQQVVLRETWAPSDRRWDDDEALAELASRYFTGHGPATLADLATWTKLPLTQLRRGIAATNDLERLSSGDDEMWMARGAEPLKANDDLQAAAPLVLLPAFDEILLGYRDRSASLRDAHAQQAASTNGIFYPLVVADGVAIGTWKRTTTKGVVHVTVSPFDTADAPNPACLETAAQVLARVMGSPVEIHAASTT